MAEVTNKEAFEFPGPTGGTWADVDSIRLYDPDGDLDIEVEVNRRANWWHRLKNFLLKRKDPEIYIKPRRLSASLHCADWQEAGGYERVEIPADNWTVR